jgi:hypothetical protein
VSEIGTRALAKWEALSSSSSTVKKKKKERKKSRNRTWSGIDLFYLFGARVSLHSPGQPPLNL